MKPYEYILSYCGKIYYLSCRISCGYVYWDLVFIYVAGNWLSFTSVAMLGAGAFTAIALLCASRTRSIPVVAGITNLITLSSMMLSGVFFSVNNLPTWLEGFSRILPLTALNNGLRKIALEGLSITELGFELTVMSVYLVISTIFTVRIFKWY